MPLPSSGRWLCLDAVLPLKAPCSLGEIPAGIPFSHHLSTFLSRQRGRAQPQYPLEQGGGSPLYHQPFFCAPRAARTGGAELGKPWLNFGSCWRCLCGPVGDVCPFSLPQRRQRAGPAPRAPHESRLHGLRGAQPAPPEAGEPQHAPVPAQAAPQEGVDEVPGQPHEPEAQSLQQPKVELFFLGPARLELQTVLG